MKAVEDNLGIHPGETTADKLFTFTEVECLGACINGPMLQINDDFYEDLTPETTHKLLDAFKAAGAGKGGQSSSQKIPPPGPMTGRSTCENSAGLTNLTGPFWGTETTRSDL